MGPSLCSHYLSFAEDVNVNIAARDAGEKAWNLFVSKQKRKWYFKLKQPNVFSGSRDGTDAGLKL